MVSITMIDVEGVVVIIQEKIIVVVMGTMKVVQVENYLWTDKQVLANIDENFRKIIFHELEIELANIVYQENSDVSINLVEEIVHFGIWKIRLNYFEKVFKTLDIVKVNLIIFGKI